MPTPEYPTVLLRAVDGSEDDLTSVLARFPVLGAQFQDEGSGVHQVTVYLAPGDGRHLPDLVADLRGIALGEPRVSSQAAHDWLQRYRESLTPFPVGRTWWIDPDPQHPSPPPEGRCRIALEPRFAFGSGSHESTQLLLLHLESCDLAGSRVLDVGTGSGVLAFASMHRGAAEVVAHDIDPGAVAVAGVAAHDQDVPRPGLFVGSLDAVAEQARFDLILCNMIVAEFLAMTRGFALRLAVGGRLLLSGVLREQGPEVVTALRKDGFSCSLGLTAGEWISLECAIHGP